MLRAIVGVIVGYFVMALLVIAGFSAAYFGIGVDGTFEPDSYDVTTKWVLIMFGVGFLAAILGGFTCAAISRLCKPPMVLAGLILVFGVLAALPSVMTAGEEKKFRDADVDNFEIMKHARTPAWVALLNPLIGAAGVLGGARLKGKRDATKAS